MIKLRWLVPLLVLLVVPSAQARPPLTAYQAHAAAQLALDASLGSLVHRGAGSASSHVGHCRVRYRRATCLGAVDGTVRCHVRLRVLLAGRLPASDRDSRLLVWSDRVDCS